MILAVARILAHQDDAPSPIQWPLPEPPDPELLDSPWVDAPTLNGLLTVPGVQIVDLRPADQYALGHLPGAISAPVFGTFAGNDTVVMGKHVDQLGIDNDRPIVLFAAPESLEKAARTLADLEGAGSQRVFVFSGGIEAWQLAAGAVETERNSMVNPSAGSTFVLADWLLQHLGLDGIQVLDLRGERDPATPQFPTEFLEGHIPGSLPFDVGYLRRRLDGPPEREDLRARLESFGPRADDPLDLSATIVLYGADSTDPDVGLAYLLFRHAGVDVRWFPGGWSAWIKEDSNPVTRVVTADEVLELLQARNPQLLDRTPTDLVVLDLRTERDFAIGHLPGARSIPFFTQSLDRVVDRYWPDIDRASTPLLLYCYGVDCVRSWKGCGLAPHFGFREILWFREGLPEWRRSGLPLRSSMPASGDDGEQPEPPHR